MNDPTVKQKAEDLVETLGISNVRWNAWEKDFIVSLQQRLESQTPGRSIGFSMRQIEMIEKLWLKV